MNFATFCHDQLIRFFLSKPISFFPVLTDIDATFCHDQLISFFLSKPISFFLSKPISFFLRAVTQLTFLTCQHNCYSSSRELMNFATFCHDQLISFFLSKPISFFLSKPITFFLRAVTDSATNLSYLSA